MMYALLWISCNSEVKTRKRRIPLSHPKPPIWRKWKWKVTTTKHWRKSQNMDHCAVFRRRRSKSFWIIPRLFLWQWLDWRWLNCSCKYLIFWRIPWLVIYFFFLRNDFFVWASIHLKEERIPEFCVSFALIVAPCVAKWITFGEYINHKCKQGTTYFWFFREQTRQ